VDEAIRGEDDRAAELIRCAVKIGDFATRFFDEDDACGDVPPLQAKFPEAIEAACGDAGEVECGGAIAADAVGTEREIVVVVNVGAGLAFVNGKPGAKQARSKRGDFGNGDFLSVQSGTFAAGSSEEFFVNWVINDAGDDLVAVRERDGNAEAGIAVGEIGGSVERVDVPAIFGVVITAETLFGGDGVRGKMFREAIDDSLFTAFVGLRDEVDVTFVFYFRRARVLFAENFPGFESGFDGNVIIGFQRVRQERLRREKLNSQFNTQEGL
jgi:hypothetical protein